MLKLAMHSTLENWCNELVDEVSLLHSDNVDDEGNHNALWFNFNNELLLKWGKPSLNEFISECSEIYSTKSTEPMWFYAWLDEQASQLRISSVSQRHGKLPFSCSIKEVGLNEVVEGIFKDDSGIFSNGKLSLWKKNI